MTAKQIIIRMCGVASVLSMFCILVAMYTATWTYVFITVAVIWLIVALYVGLILLMERR